MPGALRRAAAFLPASWRQRIMATGLRAAARRSGPVPAQAALESGANVTLDCVLCKRTATPHRVIGHVSPTQQGSFSVQDHRLVLCEACETVYLSPPPTPLDLKVMYEDSTQFTDACYTDSLRVTQILNNLKRPFTRLGLFPAPGGSCLEVGAGLAWAARVCKQHDPRIVTVAQDVSSECAGQCPWVDRYEVGPVQSLPADAGFQLISLTHVIEHLLEPREMLGLLAARLARGGHIYVTAPFRPPLWRLPDGIGPWLNYSYLHVPAHVSYLSAAWFEASCRQAGLKLLHWDPSHDGHQVFEAVLQKI